MLILHLTSLAIPIPSSFSLSRPATHAVDKHRQSPGNSMSRQVQKAFSLIGEGPQKWQDFFGTGISPCAKSFNSHDHANQSNTLRKKKNSKERDLLKRIQGQTDSLSHLRATQPDSEERTRTLPEYLVNRGDTKI